MLPRAYFDTADCRSGLALMGSELADAERRSMLANMGSIPSTLVLLVSTAGEGEFCKLGSSSSSSCSSSSMPSKNFGIGGTGGGGDVSRRSSSSGYSEDGLWFARLNLCRSERPPRPRPRRLRPPERYGVALSFGRAFSTCSSTKSSSTSSSPTYPGEASNLRLYSIRSSFSL